MAAQAPPLQPPGPHEGALAARGEALFVRGKELNGGAYSGEAEAALVAAVKLAPGHVAAWNELGECFWKKREYAMARNCFSMALDKDERNTRALRSMSMAMRQIGTGDELARNVKESVLIAKEAVAADTKDGESWYVLGNAYLGHFFHVSRDVADLDNALRAYQQAEQAGSAANPDLYHNRANVHSYRQEYASALADYRRAADLDPGWSEPDEKRTDVLRFLQRVCAAIAKRGHLKARQLDAIRQQVTGGDPVSALASGKNAGKVVEAHALHPVSNSDQLPRCYLMTDAQSFFVVPFYNLAADALRPGDHVRIVDPVVSDIAVDAIGEHFEYRAVQPGNLTDVAVNGRPVASSMLAESGVSLVAS